MRFQRRAQLWRVANRGLQQYITLNNKVLHISPTRIWTFDCQNRADPIEITPFSRNFPDPAGSSLRRTGNTLILGLVSCPRNNRYFVAIKMGRRLLVVGRGSVRAGIARTPRLGVESRSGAVTQKGSVSRSRSSNRVCGCPAIGFRTRLLMLSPTAG